jgi:peptide chain release factor 2
MRDFSDDIAELRRRLGEAAQYLRVQELRSRLPQLETEASRPDLWDDPETAKKVNGELAATIGDLELHDGLVAQVDDAETLAEMAREEGDESQEPEIAQGLSAVAKRLDELELRSLFSGEHDERDALCSLSSGEGGADAQDWTEMLLRMYLRWAESRGWKTELMEVSGGEVAGIKSATFRVEGDYAYGWLKTEIGVHRLVRKSPFDSDNRRHTSFTSVFVSPEVDDDIDIEINPADLRTDVYRSSGAGGQHVNKTESAVRITHIPTNTVVACQTGRSQHANRDTAMKMLAAKLYELEVQKRNAEKDALEATKSDIGWGSQIRNYVLDQSRIKDLRTGIERSDTQKVLDGDLDEFVEASLKSGLEAGSKRIDA